MEAGQKVTKALDIVRWRYWFFLVSAIIIIPGLISLLLPVGSGLRLGVDFTGGTLWEQRFPGAAQPAEVKQIFAAHGYDAVVQSTGPNSVLIRTKEIPAESPVKAQLIQDMTDKLGQGQPLPQPDRYETVGPTVGGEISQRATLAVALASLGILLYLWYAFRRVPNSFRYGVCAIVALLHDALVVLGIFSILGRVAGIELDSLFVTALLTVIGFSVHDTIVVFDRIRENMTRHAGETFESVVNHSLTQTLGRSLSTSLTVLFTLAALVLFGGVTTRVFALTLLIGIVSGTYSSIFNASQLLVVWENGELARLFRRERPAGAAA
jgi:preprotein translocase subunit SecF